jgi:glycosyltransferase involved in cell wall biosynthesis
MTAPAAPRRTFVINGRFLTQPTTGVQRVARELTKAMDRLIGERDFPAAITLMCEEHADISNLPLANIPVQRVPGGHGHHWEQLVLPRAVGDAELICLGNTAPLWSLAANRSVTVMIHDLSYRLYPKAYSRAYRVAHALMLPLILKRARCILTVSNSEKASLCALSPSLGSRIFVAQNGGWSDGLTVRNRTGPPQFGRDYILYVGSLSQRKNLNGLVEVAVRMAREYGVPFLFVGSNSRILAGTQIKLPEDVAPLIRFTGQVEDIELMAEIYRNARCLLFPSFYEASPLPPLEAMQFGCPVVGSDIPSMQERCGDAIDYCDPADIEDIVAAVLRVITDPQHAQELSERGFVRAGLFSWHAQAEQVLTKLLEPDEFSQEEGCPAD